MCKSYLIELKSSLIELKNSLILSFKKRAACLIQLQLELNN